VNSPACKTCRMLSEGSRASMGKLPARLTS
jgi:hypothetical protein